MKKAILATKVGMTQIFSEDGTLTPVTVTARYRSASLTRKRESSIRIRAVKRKWFTDMA